MNHTNRFNLLNNNININTDINNDNYNNNNIISLPKADNIPADQNTSPHNAGKNNNPPIRSPKQS